MGNLVSKKKKKRARDHVTDQDRAVLDLKNARDRLKRYQKRASPPLVENLMSTRSIASAAQYVISCSKLNYFTCTAKLYSSGIDCTAKREETEARSKHDTLGLIAPSLSQYEQ